MPGVDFDYGHFTGEDGLAGNPWPIYNVWQLQAIDGISVSHIGLVGISDIFGSQQNVRLDAHYRLAVDIDATPTKKWKDNVGAKAGFDPIGGTFRGFLNGGGYVVRGLFINRQNNVGLFENIDARGELAVSDLGVEDADILGGARVGIIAGVARNAGFQRVWTTGKVVGRGGDIGGLIGNSTAGLSVMMSWSAADVKGSSAVGGLIGQSFWQNSMVRFDDNWAAGNVVADSNVGGFSGYSLETHFTRNWSSGAVSGPQNKGGFLGGSGSDDRANNYANVYWNKDTSGVTVSDGDSATLSVVLQTLSSVAFGGAAASAWAFGDDNDFPLLTIHSRPWQAVNLARALTRILGISDAATITAAAGIDHHDEQNPPRHERTGGGHGERRHIDSELQFR